MKPEDLFTPEQRLNAYEAVYAQLPEIVMEGYGLCFGLIGHDRCKMYNEYQHKIFHSNHSIAFLQCFPELKKQDPDNINSIYWWPKYSFEPRRIALSRAIAEVKKLIHDATN